MTTMHVIYSGNLRTQATHFDSQAQLMTDAPKDNQGQGEAFSPTDLLATSLASCMLTIMGIKARSLNVDMKGVKVEVVKSMVSNPRKVGKITLKFDWASILANSEQIEQLKQAGLTCPVALSLSAEVEKEIIW